MSKLDEARDAAQQFFEASLYWWGDNHVGKAVYVAETLQKWPWLRPNPYQAEG